MKKAYFNCSSGVSGDMILSACISAGLDANLLENSLKEKLKLGGWELEVKEVTKKHFPAVSLIVAGRIKFGSPDKMKNIIRDSTLSEPVKARSLKTLETLINAEAKVHKLTPSGVHFHELNSIDTLVDVAGSALAFDMLGIGDIYSSPLNVGKPAPATVEIVKSKNIPVYSTSPRFEMTTPTGAAIMFTAVKAFGPMHEMKIVSSGCGAGSFDFDDMPNILNLYIGTPSNTKNESLQVPRDEIQVIETNIDDMDPRIYPYVMEKLFACGARDVWFSQVIMKKGRPGIVLSAICLKENENAIIKTIFNETTTIGVRSHACGRHVLRRELGVNVKTVFPPGAKPRVKSEFEKVKAMAQKRKTPLKDILI